MNPKPYTLKPLEVVSLALGQSDPWKKSMSAFKKAGVVVTTPSSGTYVIEEIGNIGGATAGRDRTHVTPLPTGPTNTPAQCERAVT